MATSRTPVDTGHVLGGRYLVGPRLGAGGLAEVFACEDGRLGRVVAIKLLRPEIASDEQTRRRFASEGRAAARLSHPNVVAVYDVGEDSGMPYLVLELVGGGTLKELMTPGPLPVEVVRRVGVDILAGLAAAHRARIVHRDIKPSNVLIGDDGTAKLADFGIAKSVEPTEGVDTTTTAMVIGTPGYLAPERAAGASTAIASDLWSVGVVLYEALTGSKPFQGPTPLAAALAARRGEYVSLPERRPDADPALTAAVHQALNPNPAARFPTAAAMGQVLRSQQEWEIPRGVTFPLTKPGDTDATAVLPPAPTEAFERNPTQLVGTKRALGKTRVWLAVGSVVALLALLLAWGVADSRHGAADNPAPPASTIDATTTVPVPTSPPATTPPQTSPPPPTSAVPPQQPAHLPASPPHHKGGHGHGHHD